jgi:Reverse transcriptase (RNA-dependent DNA polymerase)
VPLVLNTQTGLVSPQFHCIFDNEFGTCRRDAHFVSLWQLKAKLQLTPNKSVVPRVDIQPTIDLSNTYHRSHYPMEQHNDIPQHLVVPWDLSTPPGINADDDSTASPSPSSLHPEENDPTDDDGQSNSPLQGPEVQPVVQTRSGRLVKRPARFSDGVTLMSQSVTLAAAYLAAFSPLPTDLRALHLIQPDVEAYSEPHPLALFTEQIIALLGSDPDTMHLAEAMNADDKQQFVQAMYKELHDHINRKHWMIVPLKSVPPHKQALPMVWSMKRKRNPIGIIIKWKARLCAGGHKSVEFIDYWSTYSPVVSWSTVRILIVLALINGWYMQSIDFVLAYPQAAIKTDIYMKPPTVPPGFIIPDLPTHEKRTNSVYKLLRNLYGLKDAGKTWYDHLDQGLLKRGWTKSEIDGCLYTKRGIILVVYVDDAILISPYKTLIQKEIKSLQEEYDLTDDGELQDYLGIRFERRSDGSLKLTQPRMIERVLKIVGLDENNGKTKLHDTPASEHKILDNDPDGKGRIQGWNYRSAVGCLSYLQSMIRPDITMAVQQCARFCNAPQREHEEAVKRICRYLMSTKDEGLILKPDKNRGLECYVDADWAGSWLDRSSNDPLSSHSRTGFVILYAGCPIIWASKMQQLIALSTTEAEYIALSTALRDVIAVIHLLEDLRSQEFHIFHPTPKITCRTFEDNKSCIEIATNHKTRPRTKHLSVRLHHFRSHVVKKTITIEHISTKEQIADMFTKPLPRDQFTKLRNRLMTWSSPSSQGSVNLLMNSWMRKSPCATSLNAGKDPFVRV